MTSEYLLEQQKQLKELTIDRKLCEGVQDYE